MQYFKTVVLGKSSYFFLLKYDLFLKTFYIIRQCIQKDNSIFSNSQSFYDFSKDWRTLFEKRNTLVS